MGKLSAVVGPVVYGSLVASLLGVMGRSAYQVAIASLLGILIIGILILRGVPDGTQEAEEQSMEALVKEMAT